MSSEENLSVNSLARNYGFWMAVILVTLVAINLTIFYKIDNIAHAGMSGLCWLGVFSLLWDRRKQLKFKSELMPTIIGILLIMINLWFSRSIPTEKESNILSVAPFIFSLGIALIASGFYGLRQFLGELAIVFFLGIPRVLLNLYTDISPITARFSSFLLHYAGFPVIRDGVFINLPTGSVKVYEGCSGVESMTYVLSLAVLCLAMFPIQKKDQVYVPIVALFIGFFINAFRVMLMAILVANGNKEGFDYWHEGEGSLIFGMIAVIIFAGFYWLLMNRADKSLSSSATSAKPESSLIQKDSFFS